MTSTTEAYPCPDCGQDQRAGNYCLNCGYRYAAGAPSRDPVPPPTATPTAPPATPTGTPPATPTGTPAGTPQGTPPAKPRPLPPPAAPDVEDTTEVQLMPVGGRSAPALVGLIAGAIGILLLLAALLVTALQNGEDEDGKEGASKGSGNPSKSTPEARVTCWDGATVARMNQCAALTGPRAMTWVFPSLVPAECSPVAGAAQARRAQRCPVATDAGRARVTYLEFRTARSAKAWVRAQTPRALRELVRSERGDPDRTVRTERRAGADRRFAVASQFVGQPWVALVSAPTRAARDEAFASVDFQPLRWLRGIPDGDR